MICNDQFRSNSGTADVCFIEEDDVLFFTDHPTIHVGEVPEERQILIVSDTALITPRISARPFILPIAE